MKRSQGGFTLIEVMIVVVIVGILAAVAYPAYTSHVQRSRRADAVKLLTAVSQAPERYRSNRNSIAATAQTISRTNCHGRRKPVGAWYPGESPMRAVCSFSPMR